MQTRSKIILLTIVALILVLGVYRLLTSPQLPDPVQIQNQLTKAVAAANNKDVSEVMSIISDSYTDDGSNNPERLRYLLQRAVSSAGDLKVTSAPATITIMGDTASSSCYLSVTVDGQQIYSQVIELQWKKETTHRYLVIPDKIWRVVRSDYSGEIEGI